MNMPLNSSISFSWKRERMGHNCTTCLICSQLFGIGGVNRMICPRLTVPKPNGVETENGHDGWDVCPTRQRAYQF